MPLELDHLWPASYSSILSASWNDTTQSCPYGLALQRHNIWNATAAAMARLLVASALPPTVALVENARDEEEKVRPMSHKLPSDVILIPDRNRLVRSA